MRSLELRAYREPGCSGGEGGEGGDGGGEGGGSGGGGGAGKRRRGDPDARDLPRVALVAAQTPHRLSSSVGHAELAHGRAVHVVVEGHGADALAHGGAYGAVVGEREEVGLISTARLGVEVGSRPINSGRGAGVTGWRPTVCLCEGIWRVAATIRPAGGACGAAEVEGCGRLRRWRRGRRGRR
eukprot:scaffold28282_cov74-Phaeocystis_antarctica.AAC.1